MEIFCSVFTRIWTKDENSRATFTQKPVHSIALQPNQLVSKRRLPINLLNTELIFDPNTAEHRKNSVFSFYMVLNFAKFYKLCSSSQSAFTCSELTIETLEQGVKYVQS